MGWDSQYQNFLMILFWQKLILNYKYVEFKKYSKKYKFNVLE